METSGPARAFSAPRRVELHGILKRAFRLSVLGLVAVIPIEQLANFGPISLSRLVAALAGGIFVLRTLTGRPVRLPSTASAIAALGFLLWTATSYFWSFDPGATFGYVSRLAQLLLLVLMVWQVCRRTTDIREALAALSTGAFIGSLVSVFDRVSAHGGVPRYAVGDPNDFGVTLSIAVVASIHLLRTASSRRARLWWAVVILLQVVALLRTASRTALVAVIVGAIVTCADRSLLKPRALALLTFVSAVLVGTAVTFASTTSLGRLGTIAGAVESGDLNNRTEKWQHAIEYWSQSPITGIGAGAFRTRDALNGDSAVAHSVWFGLLSEVGLVGLALFVVLLWVAASSLRRVPDARLRLTLAAMSLAWFTGSLTLTWEGRKITWLLLALLLAGGSSLGGTSPALRGRGQRLVEEDVR